MYVSPEKDHRQIRRKKMDSCSDSHEIVIVGAGICGLATALALHRKGLKSLVIERAESLRFTGASIGIHSNGWRALDQLGVGSKLRQKSILIRGSRDILLDDNTTRELLNGVEELRCVRRGDLIETLAEGLPNETLRFNCKVVSNVMDHSSSNMLLHLDDGSCIYAKILIGCDGVCSIVAESLGLRPARISSTVGVRGLTNYPDSHGFSNEFIRIKRNRFVFGRIPIDKNLVYWFLARPWLSTDTNMLRDPKLIMDATMEASRNFSVEVTEMVKNSDLDSLSYTRIRYQAPWELLIRSFRKGTTTVAGDAMHAMGPFLGQGGSAGLEDAVVLARCLSQKNLRNGDVGSPEWRQRVETALDQYVRERRMRLVRLSMQTCLMGLLVMSSWKPVKLAIIGLLLLLFGHPLSHTHYDCGPL